MRRDWLLWICLLGVAGQGVTGQEVQRRRLLISDSPAARQVEHGVFLGVMSVRVTEEVAAQLALSVGFGLMVEEVMIGSPADKAGVKRHDVLLAFGDQELVNPEQLLALVRRSKKGDEVPLTVMSQALKKVIPAVLDEGPLAVVSERPADRQTTSSSAFASVDDHALMEHTAQGRAVRRDDSGEYALNLNEGATMFSAKPREGPGGEWTVTEESQRLQVPERFQDKLRGLLEVLERSVRTQAEK